MKRRRFVALVSSILLIMSMVLCMALPTFAVDTEDPIGVRGDWMFIDKPVVFDGIFYFDYSFILSDGGLSASYYGLFVQYFNGTSTQAAGKRLYAINDLSSPTASNMPLYNFQSVEWSSWFSSRTIRISADQSFDDAFLTWFLANATPVVSSDTPGEIVFPPKPPLVAATEGANLGAVMTQVIAILPIGLGCLVGYLGLRKALAFCRRILSGA